MNRNGMKFSGNISKENKVMMRGPFYSHHFSFLLYSSRNSLYLLNIPFFFFLLSGQNYCREFPMRSITAPRNGSGLRALSSSVGVSEVGKLQYSRLQANLSKFGVYSLNNARGKVTKF